MLPLEQTFEMRYLPGSISLLVMAWLFILNVIMINSALLRPGSSA